jgi:bifunctional oligoribonuclease and PAP phosphatase NrnA
MSSAASSIEPAPLPPGPPRVEAQLAKVADLIRAHDKFIVTAHAGPDGDAVGSTLAMVHLLKQLGKEVVAFNKDRIPYSFAFLPGIELITQNLKRLPKNAQVCFVLDCSSLERVHPDLKLDTSRTRVVVIDHHSTIEAKPSDLLVVDPTASAVGELIYRLLGALSLRLTPDVAQCLFTSVQTDTGSFRYSNTTPAALMLAAETVRAGIDVWGSSSAVYENHPAGRVRLLAQVLETLQISTCGRLAFLTVTREMYRQTGTGSEMLDGFINHARGIHGVEVATQMREVDDEEFRVSFRSRGHVNVAKAAEHFGGGGHHNAAGCTARGSAEQVRMEITAVLNRMLGST